MVAREAYFWAWPMINIYNKRLGFGQAPNRACWTAFCPLRPSTVSRCLPTTSIPRNARSLVNAPLKTKYFYQDLDASGARLNSASRHTVTFAKDQTPPVDGFRSLTLYTWSISSRRTTSNAIRSGPRTRRWSRMPTARSPSPYRPSRPGGPAGELAAVAKGRRLLALPARLLAKDRDHRRLMDAARRDEGELRLMRLPNVTRRRRKNFSR